MKKRHDSIGKIRHSESKNPNSVEFQGSEDGKFGNKFARAFFSSSLNSFI